MAGFLKGSSTDATVQRCGEERNFADKHFWMHGDVVSMIGLEWEQIRLCVRVREEGYAIRR